MNKKILSQLCAILVMMFISFSLNASNNYSATNDGYIRMDNTLGIPRVITCIQNDEFTGSAEEIAQQYITANSYFLFNNLNAEIEMIKSISDPSGIHIGFHQEINSVPIISSEIVVSLNNQNEITMITNHYKPGISVSTSPSINLIEAIQIARNSFDYPDFETIMSIQSQLSVYVDDNYTPYLVWELKILPEGDGDWYILVNAINGDIIIRKDTAIINFSRVFDPDPVTDLEDITLEDNDDTDYLDLQPAYKYIDLEGVNPPVSDLYCLQGEYAFSVNWWDPDYPISYVEWAPNFDYNRSLCGFEETNCYYHIDKTIRYVRELGFDPQWPNFGDPEELYFDASGRTDNNASYTLGGQFLRFGVPDDQVDVGEDQSVIVHETGHAIHDALLMGGIGGDIWEDCRGISEGIADYMGITYRRQSSYFLPNEPTNWFETIRGTSIKIPEDANFLQHWTADPYEKLKVWASSLMDLEYISATDPAQGLRLGRDVVTSLQLAAVSNATSDDNAEDIVIAMYQSDLNIYDGAHLKDLIEVYSNRLLFNDQIVRTNVTTNTNWEGYKLVTNDITVQNGVTLSIEPYTNLILDGNLTVEEGAQIELSIFSRIFLLEGSELIIEEGANISLGLKVTFLTPEGQTSGKVLINGSDPVVCNNIQFSNCDIYTNNTELEINGGNFTNSYLEHLNETLILDDVNFDQSYILAEKRLIFTPPFYVDIQNCSIQNSDTYGVKISSHSDFTLRNNNISNNEGAALHIYNSTNGCIENNYINNNGVGLNLNNSEAEIIGYNEICNNEVHGIVAVNTSNWSLVGTNYSPFQIVAFNYGDNAEIYFDGGSLPGDVTYNKIYDSNFDSEFVHGYNIGIIFEPIDVENNFWGAGIGGNSRIPTSYNLTPFASYDFTPVWNPGILLGGESGNAELLYDSGKVLEADEDYIASEQIYKDVISLYPESNYSKMAAKQLMTITEKTDKDYITLKHYYDNEPNMTFDEEIIKVSSSLSNQCNIKITEFSNAIDWFEDVISDPPSPVDSVLAIIDLGHTYLLMEANGDRSNYVGRYPNLKPDSWEDYEENTIQLLNGLFGDPETDPEEEPFIDIIPARVTLHGNYPNPFNPTTNIAFSIPEEGTVELNIFNIKGQRVKTLVNSKLDHGNHSFIWNGNDESNEPVGSGVYFYKLKVNGTTESVKKCLLLK